MCAGLFMESRIVALALPSFFLWCQPNLWKSTPVQLHFTSQDFGNKDVDTLRRLFFFPLKDGMKWEGFCSFSLCNFSLRLWCQFTILKDFHILNISEIKHPGRCGEVMSEPQIKFSEPHSENACSYKRLPLMCVLVSAFYFLCPR